jgi:phenylalanyl-tRNA synthetase beta chain
MKLSYNWLKQYINIDLDYKKVAEILTDIGLEVEGIEEFQSVKGGLEGLVIGEVKEKGKHPNADKLSVTKVDVGGKELLNIVCGAPNVDKGQKVVVAPIGTKLYSGDESFEIKKTKIRGELSEGMICAEDEIGIGDSHDGIMVLEEKSEIGIPAKDYFKIENDIVFEIGLTPNRIDGASHIGAARDLAAFLGQEQDISYTIPSVEHFKIDNTKRPVEVIVENEEACPRYSGITVSNITVKESPDWLKNKLKAIGLSPINNIVDATNYVLHETGHPLHAFDCDKIDGDKVVIKTVQANTVFKTLDEEERKLHQDDLMICNSSKGMCIAGVFGGIDSGVMEGTKNIFIESACFNPVYVRKTAKRHMLNTDASFRFERGVDPNDTVYALKRVALLIQEIAGGEISSEIVDVYPNVVEPLKVSMKYKNIHRLIGKNIGNEKIKQILELLEIKVISSDDDELEVSVPTYRVDVQREADVIEEILRIYGYNNIEIPVHMNGSVSYVPKPNPEILKNNIAAYLSNVGFNEIMSNSLTKSTYYNLKDNLGEEKLVKLHNPLSQDLDVMRNSLLFGGLESIKHNINRRRSDLKLFEFGNVYSFEGDRNKANPVESYKQNENLALFLTGKRFALNWANNDGVSFFDLKSHVDNILNYFAIDLSKLTTNSNINPIFSESISYTVNDKLVVKFGILSSEIMEAFDIEQEIFYADFEWPVLLKLAKKIKTQYTEIPKFPEVRRDLALLINEEVKFFQIKEMAINLERKLLKEVVLFDIYKGKNIEKGKKSYAVSYVLQDENKTLTDRHIDKIMNKFISTYKKELDAQIR